MDSYMKGAVEEYIENNRAVLEDMCERGVFSSADVEEHLESIRANIEKNIESNKAYALLMMEMDRGKAKTKYNNNYVFYAWVFPKKRYELIKLISGKLAFFETIKEELEQKKQTISKAAENLIDKNEQSLFELAK